MRKFTTAAFACIITIAAFSQTTRQLSTYLELIHQMSIYDKTIGNNPWGIGPGLQMQFNTTGKFKPIVDISGFVYLQDDKVGRLDENENMLPDVRSMVNIFAGVLYQPKKTMYVSLTTGPSFVSSQTLIGVKPAFGFYFNASQKWRGQIAFTNVFNRGETVKGDFGSVSFSIATRLF